jgi:hypothetical protein
MVTPNTNGTSRLLYWLLSGLLGGIMLLLGIGSTQDIHHRFMRIDDRLDKLIP